MDTKDFKLRTDPDPILYQKLEDLDVDQYDLPAIEESMIRCMEDCKGIGISANQVGFNKRVIVVQPTGHSPFAMFNPKVINIGTDSFPNEEGCLSFPDLFLIISRPTTIEVEYVDKEKNKCIMLFKGYDAKCVQHELDHLDGICFINRVSTLKLALAKKKQRKITHGRTK